jgi:hypothetical protein
LALNRALFITPPRIPPTADHEREHHPRSDEEGEKASTTETREGHSQKDISSADNDPDKHRFHQQAREAR